MKKALIFAGRAATALSFVGCNKEADLAPNGRKVGIVLNNAETRTVNNGMLTNWEDGDALNVFYAAAGTTEYSENTQFTVDDAASNHATGTAELTAAAYDWYLLYPYNSHVTTPANIKNGYLTVGSASNKTQTQAGLDSKAHLAGENLPVYGVVKNVAVDKPIEVSMKHVTSVVAVNLTNGTNKPLKVDEISFTAPEDIVGTYYINFAGDELVFTGSGSGYVSSTATLAVTGDNAIAAGASAKFYLAIKPFQAKSGDKLAIKVSADAGVVEKELELQSVVEFKSGVIKPMNIDYENPSSLPTITISDIASTITGSSDSFEGKLEGATVTFVSGSNAFIQDETGGILLYQSGHTLKAGDLLSGTVRGTGKVFNGLKEMTSLTVETVKSGQPIPAPVELTLAQLNKSYDEYVSVLVKVKGVTVPAGFSNRNATMTDGDETLALRDQINGLTISAGKYDIVGYPSYYNNPQFGVWAQDNIISAGSVNIFNVAPQQIDVAATDTSAEINVTGNVDWTAEATQGATVDKASGNGEAVITVSFPANTDSDKTKEYTVFVRTKATGVNDEFEVNITQAKADPAGVVTVATTMEAYAKANNCTISAGQTVVNYKELKLDDVVTLSTTGTGNNGSFWNATGTQWRLYQKQAGNLIVALTEGYKLISVSFVYDSYNTGAILDGSGSVVASGSTYATDASTIEFTVGNTGSADNGQARITEVVIKYEKGQGTNPPAATLTSIAVTGQKTEFNVGEAFTHDTAVVTATYSDNTTKDVTASATFSSPDMTVAGTKEVTVTYTEGGVTKTASYDITVSAAAASTVAAVLAGGPGTYSVEGMLVYAVSGPNAIVGDASGKMLLYLSNHGLAVGDLVDATNVVVKEYNGVLELTSGTYNKKSSGNPVDHGTPTSLDDATAAQAVHSAFSAEGFHSAQFVSITGTQDGRYIENESAKLYMNVADATNDGHQVVSTGYVYSYSTKYSNYNYQVVTIEKAANEKFCLVSPDVLNVAATATSATLTIQANVAWTVTSDNSAFTVSPASGNSDATVTVSFAANTTETAKVAKLTVSSPEASVTKEIVLTQAGQAAAGTDVLDQTLFGISGANYTDFSGKTGSSGAVYAGNCAASYNSIQLRSNNSNSGVITTASGGKVTKVVVTWNSNTVDGRTLDIYGKSTAYSAASDLYNSSDQGTLLGTVVCGTSTELTVTGDYEFIGFRSHSGALYLDKVEVSWK